MVNLFVSQDKFHLWTKWIKCEKHLEDKKNEFNHSTEEGTNRQFSHKKHNHLNATEAEGNKMKTIIASLGIEINCALCRRVQTQYDK